MGRKPGRMASLGNKTFEKTTKEMSDEESSILLKTTINWEELRPQINDDEAFNKMIEAVKEATKNNEDIAQLKSRLVALGEGVVGAAKTVATIVTKLS